jgi:hypothetical protein
MRIEKVFRPAQHDIDDQGEALLQTIMARLHFYWGRTLLTAAP